MVHRLNLHLASLEVPGPDVLRIQVLTTLNRPDIQQGMGLVFTFHKNSTDLTTM